MMKELSPSYPAVGNIDISRCVFLHDETPINLSDKHS